MLLKFDILEKFRTKFDELNYYMIEYEGFIEKNGAPFCDFVIYRGKKDKLSARDLFNSAVHRSLNILKSFSRKIEFGDMLKRVQETIRMERAEEKKIKKEKFNESNKTQTQTQINGKMIGELKSEMRKMKAMIEAQNDMLKSVLGEQPMLQKLLINEGESDFKESNFSSPALSPDKSRILHGQTLIDNLGHDFNTKNEAEIYRSATHAQHPSKDEWD
jgi:hypothetical protein